MNNFIKVSLFLPKLNLSTIMPNIFDVNTFCAYFDGLIGRSEIYPTKNSAPSIIQSGIKGLIQ